MFVQEFLIQRTLYAIQTNYLVERDYFITQSIQQHIKNVVSVACIHYEN